MTYEQSIEELKELIKTGAALEGRSNVGTREFRDWRLRAESIVQGIRAEGYVLPGPFGSPGRPYQPTWSPSKPEAKRSVFDRDLGDSLSELRLLVDHFDKYGAPLLSRSQSAPTGIAPVALTPLPVPERVTLKWLIEYVSVPLWVGALAIVGAVALGSFFVGFELNQVPAARGLVCWLKTDACLATGADKTSVPPSLYLQFSDMESVPKEIRQNDIFAWWANWSAGIQVDELAAQNDAPLHRVSVPPHWVVFIVFDKPATFRQLISTCSGPQHPKCSVDAVNNRFAVIKIDGDVTQMTLDVSTAQ